MQIQFMNSAPKNNIVYQRLSDSILTKVKLL